MSIDSTNTSKNTALYSDLNSLRSITTQAVTDKEGALKEVAKQFEQIFLSQMLKSMRDANSNFSDPDNVFTGGDVRFYQDMLDQQMTIDMVEGRGIGLADILAKQLSNQFNASPTIENDTDLPVSGVAADSWIINPFVNQASLAAAAVLGDYESTVDEADIDLKNSIQQLERLKEELYSNSDEQLPDQFSSSQEFVDSLLPLAQAAADELGVDPKVLLAQAALETGWGKHMVRDANGENSFNLFNIKAGRSWDGESKSTSTLEFRGGVMNREVAQFRSYDSYADSFSDYVQFLKNSPRYEEAVKAAAEPEKYLQLLQKAGYATDPKYAEKITNIFQQNILASNADNTNEI